MDTLIRDVPVEKIVLLKQRARRNHRSLQGELLALIDEAVDGVPRKLTVEEVALKVSALGLTQRDEAASLIRKDRDR